MAFHSLTHFTLGSNDYEIEMYLSSKGVVQVFLSAWRSAPIARPQDIMILIMSVVAGLPPVEQANSDEGLPQSTWTDNFSQTC